MTQTTFQIGGNIEFFSKSFWNCSVATSKIKNDGRETEGKRKKEKSKI